jgi:hypothetical protein
VGGCACSSAQWVRLAWAAATCLAGAVRSHSSAGAGAAARTVACSGTHCCLQHCSPAANALLLPLPGGSSSAALHAQQYAGAKAWLYCPWSAALQGPVASCQQASWETAGSPWVQPLGQVAVMLLPVPLLGRGGNVAAWAQRQQ